MYASQHPGVFACVRADLRQHSSGIRSGLTFTKLKAVQFLYNITRGVRLHFQSHQPYQRPVARVCGFIQRCADCDSGVTVPDQRTELYVESMLGMKPAFFPPAGRGP